MVDLECLHFKALVLIAKDSFIVEKGISNKVEVKQMCEIALILV
jgi:hypothetical protein